MNALHNLFTQNDTQTFLNAAATFLISFAAMHWGLRLLLKRLGKLAARTATWWDDVLVDGLGALWWPVVTIVAFYFGSTCLVLPASIDKLIDRVAIVALLLQLGLCADRALHSWQDHRTAEERDRESAAMLAKLGIVRLVSQFMLWILLVLLALDNIGINITALVTSLGIGGVAIALAVQNVLGDLFASLSIALDKPFLIGDFIVVDDHMGTVKHVGLKTTRLQSLSGEELVFSNTDLLKSRIRNYKYLAERRVVFNFDLDYATPRDKIERVVAAVRKAIEAHDSKVRVDRVHFSSFSERGLRFEAVYYMLDPDYNQYMDVQQSVNLTMLDAFAGEGVSFAYPTRTLHLASMPPIFETLAERDVSAAPRPGMTH